MLLSGTGGDDLFTGYGRHVAALLFGRAHAAPGRGGAVGARRDGVNGRVAGNGDGRGRLTSVGFAAQVVKAALPRATIQSMK